ncbi:CHAT domain-containing protein [Vararia minispora EC-137]|uniref:CHAT domain-containing protein n=1 Tax=Vararia minispora EC-137 TaxID=1314806 RepID=A0ACB8QAT0_9AGAM|nr:CHAT domain-containing protein [Vararia minispora EC-137]
MSLRSRFDRLGHVPDIEDAVAAQRRAVALAPDVHPNKTTYLSNLGISLQVRFDRLGHIEDLTDALLMKRRAVELASDDHPDKAAWLTNLGNSFESRFGRFGNLEDLEDALKAKRLAVEITPDNHPSKPIYLNNLSISLDTRFDRLGDPQDLEDSLAAMQCAAELMPDDNPNKPNLLSNLGVSLRSRFDRLGHLQDLNAAIAAARRAVQLMPDDHPGMPGCLNGLGVSLQASFDQSSYLPDLESAIASLRRAVELMPDDHPEKPPLFTNLGISFRSRFDRLGRLEDLEDAVLMGRHAVAFTPDDHPDMPTRLNNFSISLQTRFKRLGHLQDLEDAIAVQRRVVNLTPDNQPTKPARLSNLGLVLELRFGRLGQPDDLEDALTAGRRAVELTPNDHPDKSIWLTNLGNSLETRFRQFYDFQDLEDSIAVHRSATVRTPDSHPLQPLYLSNYGTTLHLRFILLENLQDLADASAIWRRAVNLMPDGHANKSARLFNLGISMRSQLHHSPSQSHFSSSFNCFMDASVNASGLPHVRLRAALECASICRDFSQFDGSYEMTLRAHQTMLDAIPPFIWLGQGIPHRFEQLSTMHIGSAITAAASAAIAAGKPSRALEWLEEGRSIVWGQLTRLRNPLDDLQAHDPVLAQRLRKVSVALELAGQRSTMTVSGEKPGTLQDSTFITSSSRLSLEDEAREHRKLANEYETLLGEARKIEGFEHFMRPKTLAMLAPAYSEGPIAVINVDRSRCDVLILSPSENLIHVPLPNLTHQIAMNMHSQLIACLGPGARRRDTRAVRVQTTGVGMQRILRLLWERIVHPVLVALDDQGRLLHMTWCATGPLSSLPLHAAGIYGETDKPTPKASDFIVSSYTPSLSALLSARAQQRGPVASANPKILIVSQPQTPGQRPLPCTVAEAATVTKHFPENATHLDDSCATVDAIFDSMMQHDWVHLACHGEQDPRSPTGSAFMLHDGRLELSRLMGMSHARAELAVLSACQTAKGNDDLPEEAVHLSAGMLAAGYQSVVATMWSISDEDGPVLADALYAALKRNLAAGKGLRVAYALHEATTKLRVTVGKDNFARWVPFVHFGI